MNKGIEKKGDDHFLVIILIHKIGKRYSGLRPEGSDVAGCYAERGIIYMLLLIIIRFCFAHAMQSHGSMDRKIKGDTTRNEKTFLI